jgi:ABC-type bacteriocin/lantibiotic exporter with double-glycine peptidase domain
VNSGLSSWFALWHRRYRVELIGLILAGTLASAFVYFENDLLDLLTQSLAPRQATVPGHGLPALAGQLAGWLQISVPFLALGLFVATRLASGAVEFFKAHLAGKLSIRTKDDLETEILLHLLRKEDSFFSRHSPAEMVNRLGVDLGRVSERRPALMKVWWSSLLLAGNLVFFFLKDWRLAVVAIVAGVAGVLWTLRITKPVVQMDKNYCAQDDRIKSRFEDLLRTAPEVQVANFYEKIRLYFRQLLQERTSTFLKFIRLNGTLRIGDTVSYLLAFASMILVVYYMRQRGISSVSLALIPVIVLRLPSLFNEASELVFLRLDFQIARASMGRLLEYETHAAETDAPLTKATAPGAAEPITLQQATYRYSSADGTQQSGIVDIGTTFVPGRWTAIVGGAGSGKSTLIKLLLGRLKAQDGRVLYGQTPSETFLDSQRAALFSIMPQSTALLNTTILENLLFGRSENGAQLSAADIDVIERAGLGRICRLKALEMMAGQSGELPAIATRISELRNGLRERIRKECEAVVLPFEQGHSDAQHWLLECLLAGRCDRAQCVDLLLNKKAARKLQTIAQTGAGATLVELGRSPLRENRHLLSIPNYHVYTQLSPCALSEPLWKLRSSSVDLADKIELSPKEAASLCLVALTSSIAELACDERAEALRQPESRKVFAAEIEVLRQLLGDAWQPFVATEVHPHLAWRENLIFGVVEVRNNRTSRLLDKTLLSFVEEAGLNDCLTRLGVKFEIGRLGSNLSGGQGQLVALCRALLRRTPVLVLDEPTSALDPASRSTVAALLKEWKHDRIVITVSHDMDFVREADEIKLVDGGRLAASGTFQELKEGSEAFRKTLKQA